MLTLYQFPHAKSVPSYSPFCLKLETWLRMANIEYDNKSVFNPAKSPKGKLPIIKLDGKTYTDSELIIDFLKKRFQVDLDDHLSPEQLAQHYADEILFTERLNWLIAYFRWQDDEGWALTKPKFFPKLPFPLNYFVPSMVRKKMIKAFYVQGLGRHSKEELMHLAEKALYRAAFLLNNKPYFGGSKPTTLDASAFGSLANIILSDVDIELSKIATTHENLTAYCTRMRDEFFSDFKK